MMGYFTSKFERFRSNRVLRRILGTGVDAVPLDELMDNQQIVLVKIDKARLGTVNARLLGYLWLTKLWTSAMRRTNVQPFTTYVDEVHTVCASAIPTLISEGRKWGVRLVVAHQFAHQLRTDVAQALIGNAATSIAFRMGDEDAQSIGTRFAPEFSAKRLRYLENFEAACLMLSGGQPLAPFDLWTSPPVAGNPSLISSIVARSQSKWGTPCDEVDAHLRDLIAS
jgi:hypothetical protein